MKNRDGNYNVLSQLYLYIIAISELFTLHCPVLNSTFWLFHVHNL
jgi:hypothetical protein